MGHHPIVKGIKIALFVVVGSIVFGFIVKGLWNVLVPPIIGWHTITFWQALGLLLLSKILFGGFHRHGGRASRSLEAANERSLGEDDTRGAR